MVGLVEWEGLEQDQRTNRNRSITPWDRTIVQATTALMTENMKVLMAEEAAIVLQTVGTIPTAVALVTEAAQEVSLLLLAIVIVLLTAETITIVVVVTGAALEVLNVTTGPLENKIFITPRFVQIPVTTVRMTTYLPTQRVAPSLLETNKEMMDYPSFVVMILTVVAV